MPAVSRQSFFVGGTYAGPPEDRVMHGQMYVEMLKPARAAHPYPLVLEVAFAPKWTLGLEYLYFDLGKVSTTTEFVSGDFPDVTLTAESKIAGDIARVLLNYRFY